ncbi:MAG: peptidylprolyl isomerase [Holophaga sp.]|nr:peptidylprolyl isomerase [Holophaga sp.]
MRLALALLGLPLLATSPVFTAKDALQAEWRRQAPTFSDAEKRQLPQVDRVRLEQTLARIGAPGAPALLPPELEKPTLESWEAKASLAKLPQDRFTALYFLNRLKSPRALTALNGLTADDAKTWPKFLHLEAGLATARLNGGQVGPELQGFLDGLQQAGKVDPVRAQAARLRLVMAGKEKELLPAVAATPGSLLALLDAWNRAPWEKRRAITLVGFQALDPASPAWPAMGLVRPDQATLETACVGILSRLSEGTPDPAPEEILKMGGAPWACANQPLAQWYAAQTLPKFKALLPDQLSGLRASLSALDSGMLGTLLPGLRKHLPEVADKAQAQLLTCADPVARAAAIDDMTKAPSDLDALIQRLWKTEEYDGVQVLLPALAKWKLPEDRRRAILQRFLTHPCWTARLDAWTALSKLEPKTPWPMVPSPAATDRMILKEATRLAALGRPVRMRLIFGGNRQVVLKLDPINAPMNVANLVILARKGFFNGRLVPRVVPDFVVQMGSPCDTMDGGPGYTVRCENSLAWYGPGSVGMALSGKDTGGSQFFITTNATPHLTGKYTRVGEVEALDQAMKVLDDLELGAKLERVEILAPGTKR